MPTLITFGQSLKPKLPGRWLMALAGLMWTAVGLMLSRYAFLWLAQSFSSLHAALGLAGIAAAAVIYRFGFRRLAHKNIKRIRQLNEPACLFAFLEWKSYAIVAVMITGGVLLRHSAIPKPHLAVLYAGIGGGLFLSSFAYYGYLWKTTGNQFAEGRILR